MNIYAFFTLAVLFNFSIATNAEARVNHLPEWGQHFSGQFIDGLSFDRAKDPLKDVRNFIAKERRSHFVPSNGPIMRYLEIIEKMEPSDPLKFKKAMDKAVSKGIPVGYCDNGRACAIPFPLLFVKMGFHFPHDGSGTIVRFSRDVMLGLPPGFINGSVFKQFNSFVVETEYSDDGFVFYEHYIDSLLQYGCDIIQGLYPHLETECTNNIKQAKRGDLFNINYYIQAAKENYRNPNATGVLQTAVRKALANMVNQAIKAKYGL